jgi:hypothetical protein
MKVKKSEEEDEFSHNNFTGIVEYCDGTDYVSGSQVRHLKNGLLHREDGPAIEWTTISIMQWWLSGEYYIEEIWKNEVEILKLKRSFPNNIHLMDVVKRPILVLKDLLNENKKR